MKNENDTIDNEIKPKVDEELVIGDDFILEEEPNEELTIDDVFSEPVTETEENKDKESKKKKTSNKLNKKIHKEKDPEKRKALTTFIGLLLTLIALLVAIYYLTYTGVIKIPFIDKLPINNVSKDNSDKVPLSLASSYEEIDYATCPKQRMSLSIEENNFDFNYLSYKEEKCTVENYKGTFTKNNDNIDFQTKKQNEELSFKGTLEKEDNLLTIVIFDKAIKFKEV